MAVTTFTTGPEAVKSFPTESGWRYFISFDTPIAKERSRIAKERAVSHLQSAREGWRYQVVTLKSERKVLITEDRS